VNPKLPISLTNLQKTLLITLYAKAVESRSPDSILKDHYAAEAAERIAFDFSRFNLSHNAMIALAIRAKVLDQWTEQFLHEHPAANVLHIGCGLDSRYFRLQPPPEVAWWEVDYPEVIDLREQVYGKQTGARLLPASILEESWLQEIPSDVPTLVVAEGVLPYFTAVTATQFLSGVVSHFDSGQIAFDAYNRWGVMWLNRLPIMRQTHEKLNWAVDDPRELERAVPTMKLKVDNTEAIPQFVGRAGFWSRTAFRLSRSISPFKRMGQLLLYDFGST